MNTKVSVPWPRPGQPITKVDLELLPDDGRRYELIDGVLVVSPTPTWQHQGALRELVLLLNRSCPEELEVFIGPLNVELAEDTVLRPDALIVRQDRLGEEQLGGMPELTIEVASPNTWQFDLILKQSRYEEAGCPSYWVVDPAVPSIVAWDLVDGRYVEAGRAEGDAELVLTRPYHVVVNPARLVD